MNQTLCYVLLPIVISLAACNSVPTSNGVTVKNERMFTNEVNYPSWYTEAPKKDDKGIYSVGSEYSKDFQFSVDKAMLSAKRELASQFSSYTSAMMKDFAYESGMTGSDVARADLERTTKMVVSRVNLVGVQRVNMKTVHEENGYRTFVRLLYTEDASNRILLSEIRRNQALYAKFRASKSFQELERETDKIDQQKVEEIKALTQQ